LNQAGDASSVRWRAAHLRLEHIFSAAAQKEQQAAKQEEHRAPEGQTPRQKEGEQARKSGKAGTKRITREKGPVEEEKTQATAANSESPGDRGKTNEVERKSSTQGRGEDAA